MKKKALILAAGLGTRLAPITNDRPKSLVPVNGKPILLKQIENLKANDIEDITVVSGYKADFLEKAVHEKCGQCVPVNQDKRAPAPSGDVWLSRAERRRSCRQDRGRSYRDFRRAPAGANRASG